MDKMKSVVTAATNTPKRPVELSAKRSKKKRNMSINESQQRIGQII
jgi:hypothetical protein